MGESISITAVTAKPLAFALLACMFLGAQDVPLKPFGTNRVAWR
jgi:hypothetical protein